MNMITQTIIGALVAVGGVALVHFTGISDAIDDSLEGVFARFKEYPYRKHVLVLIIVALGVVLVLSVINVITCYYDPVCYIPLIREVPVSLPDTFNQSAFALRVR